MVTFSSAGIEIMPNAPALALIVMIFAALSGCAHNAAPSSKPPEARDTPADAMNTFSKAVADEDVATVADSYDSPRYEACRTALAQRQIAFNRLLQAVEAHWGYDAGVRFRSQQEPDAFFVEPIQPYKSDDFRSKPWYPNIPAVTFGPNEALQLCRGPDGIWRIDPGLEQISPGDAQHMVDLEQKRAELFRELTYAVNTGKLRKLYDLNDAIESGEFAIQRDLRMRWQAGAYSSTQTPSPDRAKLDAANFDKSTVRGAIAAYQRAFMERDKKAIADFLYSDGDPDGTLLAANTDRLVTVFRLKDAIDQKFANRGEGFVSDEAGLITPADLVWWCDVEQQQGDRAVGVFEDNSRVSFRKVDGVWKLDITPPKPQTPTDLAKLLEHNAQILDQITADVLAGKYKELPDVRDALISANLVEKSAGN